MQRRFLRYADVSREQLIGRTDPDLFPEAAATGIAPSTGA